VNRDAQPAQPNGMRPTARRPALQGAALTRKPSEKLPQADCHSRAATEKGATGIGTRRSGSAKQESEGTPPRCITALRARAEWSGGGAMATRIGREVCRESYGAGLSPSTTILRIWPRDSER
jgi:hypothetical protein